MIVSTILQLISEAKYLEAEIIYKENIELLCKEPISDSHHHIFGQMLHRASQVKEALRDNNKETANSSESDLDDWILGMTYLGVTTHYKMDESNYLHVRLEGILDDIDIFKSAAVIYEVDYFSHWLRFLNQTKLIHKVDVTELVAYFSTYIPPLSRDTVVHVYAADCLSMHDQIVLIGKSEHDWPISSTSPISTNNTNNIPSITFATGKVEQDSQRMPSHHEQQSVSNSISEDEVVTEEFIVREENGFTVDDNYNNTSAHRSHNNSNPTTSTTTTTNSSANNQNSSSNSTTIASSSSSSSSSSLPVITVTDESTVAAAPLLSLSPSPSPSQLQPPLVVIPWQPIGWFHDRMEIRDFKAVFTVLSATRVKTIFVACIDPRAALPRNMVNFVIRNIAGLFLYLFQKQVLKVGNGPDCPYNERVRQNPSFYRDWLLPKLKSYYDKQGWEFKFENNSLMETVQLMSAA